jgi:pSer/pThr/pTyr-binding forkhead associated (FHA) protein
VRNDPAVSGHHLTILHRMGHFKFKDELSTNGTFINDVFEEEGNLKDGDIIKMGDTIFKFRSIA